MVSPIPAQHDLRFDREYLRVGVVQRRVLEILAAVVCANVGLAASTAGTFNLVVKVARQGRKRNRDHKNAVSVNSSAADPNSANQHNFCQHAGGNIRPRT